MRQIAPSKKTIRLLITRHDKIGDFVLSLPLCKAIKESNPEIHLAVLVSKVNYDFAQQLDFIDEVLLFNRNIFKLAHRIRQHKFDASISCYIDINLGIALFLSGVPIRIAPATKFAQIFFNQTLTQRRSLGLKTEWSYNLDLGRSLFQHTPLTYNPPLIKIKSTKCNRVVIHPGYGGSSDGNLTLKDYLRLGASAAKLGNVEIVFTFGPDDEKAMEYINEHLAFPATLFKSQMSLFEFCRYLSECRLFISTSTGPMHLAAAVNTNTLSFFGSSRFASPNRWSSVNADNKQNNFMLSANYTGNEFEAIESRMLQILNYQA